MAKIILLYVVTFLMIFPLFWNHGNATPRKLGVRQNAVTSLPNTYRGSAGQYYLISSPLVHTNAETLHILGSRQNAVTSLPNTKEATFDGPGHQYFTISSSLSADHANVATPSILGARSGAITGKATFGGSKHQDYLIPSSLADTNVIIPQGPLINPNEATSPKFGTHQNPIIITSLPNINEVTNSGESGLRSYPISSGSPTQTDVAHYLHRFPLSQMWQPKQSKVIPHKLWARRHNVVTSLSNTNKEITSRSSGIQHYPIARPSTHTHATTRRITQTRYGASTSLLDTNKASTSRGSSRFQHSPISSSSAHTLATTRRILQTRNSGATSLSDTNKAITSPASGLQRYLISSSSAHTHATPRRVLQTRSSGATSLSNANKAITSRASGLQHYPISSLSAHTHAITRRILQTGVGGVTSLLDTNKAITSRGSGIDHYPISSLSTHTHATTPHTLEARHNAVTSSPNADEETTCKHGACQNPIIITSLPSTIEATNSGESKLHFPPISSSPTQINRVFPRDPDETGHVSSIVN